MSERVRARVNIGGRLLVVSTIEVAVILWALLVALGVFAFSSYVSAIRGDLAATLIEVEDELKAAPPSTAAQAGGTIAAGYLRSNVEVIVLDRGFQRVVVYRSQRPDTPPRIVIGKRGDLSGDPKPRGAFAQPILGLATAFGLQSLRSHIGAVDVIVRTNEAVLTSAVGRFVVPVAVALLFSLVIAFAIARILTQQMLRPLVDVTAALERFASGDLTPQQIGANPRQEFGRLAVAYNAAIEQMERAFAERERANASMRQFIADAGHQLRTPLTVIRGFLGILRRGGQQTLEDRDRILETMSQQSQIMASLIDKLMLLEQWENVSANGHAEAIDVGQLVSDVTTPIAEANAGRRVVLDAHPGPLAAIDPGDLTHAVTNLVDNALKYTRGAIKVGVRTENGRVAIDVIDEGPGIDAETAAHVFDRFYRGTQRDVPGSGLGLAIAKRAIERAGGTLQLESSPASGSHFTIQLPRISDA